MATTNRKKSVASTTNDMSLPTQTNTLLNKSASSSSSLYQQCSQLRTRLHRVQDFNIFLERSLETTAAPAIDPVNHLWDCFALGIPLCYLFNLLPPPAAPIDINTDPSLVELDNLKATKIAIIKFIMAVQKMQQQGDWEAAELFQVTELTDRNMDGFVKVVNTVTYLVDRLPSSVFVAFEEPPSPLSNSASYPSGVSTLTSDPDSPTIGPSSNSREVERRPIILELINTERKFVADLEVMQKYATTLLQRSVIDQDTILELFPGLAKLLDFQRRFLIRLEQVAELPWPQQRWGKCFSECEAEFEVYVPYCINYDNAMEVLLREEQHLMELATIIHPKSELPAFLIKPVQRICKYPLLLDSLIKVTTPAEYPYYQELVEGAASAKRVTQQINEAQRRTENRQIMKALESRIEDWKGHHIVNFGELLLQDFFSVTKSEVDRDYHVFLFEKIILCCKEDPRALPGTKKVGKSNSILKKQAVATLPNPIPGGSAASARKGTTPLLLKGRIFLNNVIEAIAVGKAGSHDLRVSWRGDDDTEHFTLRCRNEEQLKLWETQITRLIYSSNTRRRTGQSISGPNSTNPAALRMQNLTHDKFQISGHQSVQYSSSKSSRASTPYGNEERLLRYQGQGGFDFEDEYDDMLPVSVYPTSGRGTPIGSRRVGSAQSMPPERDIPPGYDRPRARTEDHTGPIMQQWRITGHGIPPPPPPPIGSLPLPPGMNGRPGPGRTGSNNSVTSDFGFGHTAPPPPRPLRSQFSTNKLRSTYDSDETLSGETIVRTASAASGPSQDSMAHYMPARSRSASIPSTYSTMKPPPPLPPPVPSIYSSRMHTSGVERGEKRDSGSSHSTQSSDYSPPHSTSPITPYGSTDSSLASSTLHRSRSQMLSQSNNGTSTMKVGQVPIKVKVHYGDDLFVIVVNRTTDFRDLVEKVGKKIRLCGGRRDGAPLRVRYQDEDGDMVSLGSNEDMQMAFDTTRSSAGGQVTLYVT